MRSLPLLACAGLAMTLGACARPGPSPAMLGRLDCPLKQGDLTRVTAAADGKSCAYRASDGADVTLSLIPVAGDPVATLAKIETDLRGEAGTWATTGSGSAVQPAKPGALAEAQKAEAEAKADAKAAETQAQQARKEARAAEGEAKDAADEAQAADDDYDRAIEAKVKAKLDAHGIKVEEDGHDRAHVDLPFIHIDADGDKADVNVGPIHVNANGLTVKVLKEVRLRGEGLSPHRNGVRATFIQVGENLDGGYKFVAYEAAGPKAGPLAVAVVKSKVEENHHGDAYGDVRRLVRRNGGI